MAASVNAMVHLRETIDGTIAITVRSFFQNERLAVDDTTLLLTLWSEGPDVVRGRLQHEESREFAYFQSNDPSLRRLAEAMHLVGPRKR